MSNYNPQKRLHAFIPRAPREQTHITNEVAKVRVARASRSIPGGVIVIVHSVSMELFYEELNGDYGTQSVRDMCNIVTSKTELVALGEAKTPKMAADLSATFGTGNLLIYAIADPPSTSPQYIALGVTAGCTVDGLKLRGTWTLLTAFGGSENPFTQLAIESNYCQLPHSNLYDSVFQWTAYPSKRTMTSYLLRQNFAKKFVKVWSTYAQIVDARAAGTLAMTPETRAVLLLELLFTSSEISKRVFLQNTCTSQESARTS